MMEKSKKPWNSIKVLNEMLEELSAVKNGKCKPLFEEGLSDEERIAKLKEVIKKLKE